MTSPSASSENSLQSSSLVIHEFASGQPEDTTQDTEDTEEAFHTEETEATPHTQEAPLHLLALVEPVDVLPLNNPI